MSEMASRLTTARVDLRAFQDDDVDGLHAIFSDPNTHVIGDGPVDDISFTREWIRRRHQRRVEHGVVWYAVRLRGEAAVIGTAGLFMGRTEPFPELGFEIHSDQQGIGLGREAAAAVVAEGRRAGFVQIWATVREWNEPSLRALLAVGFGWSRVEHDERGALIFLCLG